MTRSPNSFSDKPAAISTKILSPELVLRIVLCSVRSIITEKVPPPGNDIEVVSNPFEKIDKPRCSHLG
jgi:hypothetical protein